MTQRITLETEEYQTENDDGEPVQKEREYWMELNSRAAKRVQELATEENLRFGDALARYVTESLTESDE